MNRILKKLYAAIGVLVMLLPIALGAMSGSVKAEETETPAGLTQSVILTKLGFNKGEEPEDLTVNGKPWDEKNYNGVSGVQFEVYDVTDAFKKLSQQQKNGLREANEKAASPKEGEDSRIIKASPKDEDPVTSADLIKGLTPIKTETTDDKGKITFENLPSDHKYYIFREVIAEDKDDDVSKTYKPSKDLLLSLTQYDENKKPLDVVYLYPKNYAGESTELKFKKVDVTNEKQTLEGAKFVFSKKMPGGETAYAQKVKGETKAEDGDVYDNIMWVGATLEEVKNDKAFQFTSNNKGLFSIKAKPSAVSNNKGEKPVKNSWNDKDLYGIAVGDVISFEEIEAPEGYETLPEGSFTVMEKDDNSDSSKVKSDDADKGSYKLYLGATDKNIFIFEDSPKGLLPHTGGMGIVLFVLAGAALVVVGSYAYKKQRA